jgi:hypothetical protein
MTNSVLSCDKYSYHPNDPFWKSRNRRSHFRRWRSNRLPLQPNFCPRRCLPPSRVRVGSAGSFLWLACWPRPRTPDTKKPGARPGLRIGGRGSSRPPGLGRGPRHCRLRRAPPGLVVSRPASGTRNRSCPTVRRSGLRHSKRSTGAFRPGPRAGTVPQSFARST